MRYTQPQNGPIQIDWSNPITRGLAATFDMRFGAPVDILSRYTAGSGQFTRVTCVLGIGQKKSGFTSDGSKTILGANPTSAVVISAPPSSGTIKPFFSQRPSGGGVQYSFGANWNTAFGATAGTLGMLTNGSISLTSASVITGQLDVYGYSITSTTTGQLYVRGQPVPTTVTSSGYPSITSPEFNVLSHLSTSSFNDTSTPYLCLWNRALSAVEHASLAANPWQLFRSPQRVLVAATGGGTSYSYTATGGVSLSGTALTLRGRVLAGLGGLSLAGAASLVFTTAVQSLTVTPVGGLTLSGIATMVRTIVKVASGGITVSGSAAVSLTPDPTPTSTRHFKRGRRPRTKT